MIFLKANMWPWLILGLIAVGCALTWTEAKFFKWVREHWFFKRRKRHMLSSLLLFAGFGLLSVILLDPRSGEIKIKGKIRQDRTIILIDTSTSMLAEDVRPSRLDKAVLIAKHFARKAVGHQIGVMVFADITKKLVPFTSDLDLLDSRIDSIKQLRNMNAGSSIGLAIEEAVRFFDPKDASVAGNILVITDGEDNADTESFKVPEGVSLALVGVGTKSGAAIPMKDNFGMFYGQKKSQGITVVTKLNEEFFATAVKNQLNAKYFLAQSYDLPTEEILAFFDKRKGIEKEGENVVRPVAMEAWSIPALVMLLLAYLLRFSKPFALSVLIFAMPVFAQEKEAPELPPEVVTQLQKLKSGDLDRDEKINLADQLVKFRMHDMAQALYDENMEEQDFREKPNSAFNWATSELETGKFESALQKYDQLEKLAEGKRLPEGMDEKMRENIRRAITPPPQQDKKDKKNKEQDKQENQDQKNSGKDGEGQKGEQKGGEGQSQGKPQHNQQGKEGDKNPFDPNNKDKKEEKPQDQGNKKDQGDEGDKEKEKDKDKQSSPSEAQEGDKKGQKRKVSPLLEQLKQDDRKLQLKLLDTSTQKRKEGRKKDW